jgi:Arc/MetJ family transcription regulator
MQIDIIIDDELLQRAAQLSGISDYREIIETALSLLITTRERERSHPTHSHMSWEDGGEDS